jgi:hypothetical protein
VKKNIRAAVVGRDKAESAINVEVVYFAGWHLSSSYRLSGTESPGAGVVAPGKPRGAGTTLPPPKLPSGKRLPSGSGRWPPWITIWPPLLAGGPELNPVG